MTVNELLDRAILHKSALAIASNESKNRGLTEMAAALIAHTEDILDANRKDIEEGRGTISPVMIDRLTLTESRIQSMAEAILAVTELPDPVGRKLETITRPNGLVIEKISVPLGVLAMIYESRPNVTSDAAALALKSGNVCVLRGGKEAIRSNIAIVSALREGLSKAGLPEDALQLVTDTSRDSAAALMTAIGKVDLLIPRGGAGLIRSCVENARVPCIETGTGICHVYVDEFADLAKALAIVNNAKTSRPSVCNAMEVLLVHREVAPYLLPRLEKLLVFDRIHDGVSPVELRLCPRSSTYIHGKQAEKDDFDTEYLDYKLAIKIVDSVDEAITHIFTHSTGHSESIVTENSENAAKFTALIDSAAVYVNASTRFTDGGEFGLGCEMGISTQKLHARGPMGLRELTSYKYIIHGDGQIR